MRVWRVAVGTIVREIRRAQARLRQVLAEFAVMRVRKHGTSSHLLPAQVIVSLTSYPARYPTLAKTLRSLLSQRVQPDHVVLWIAESDFAKLPRDVLILRQHGLLIECCADLRSYKKLVPSLIKWPDSYIVTADDDLFYPVKWLETLLAPIVSGEKVIVCRRAHKPTFNAKQLLPYAEWEWDYVTRGEIRTDLFPSGAGGIVYPPQCLSTEVTDERAFLTLCPTADDIWFFVMARRAGTPCRQVGGGFPQIAWSGTQSTSLMIDNLNGGNDRQLAAVMSVYGANWLQGDTSAK